MTWSYDNSDLDLDTETGRLNATRVLLGDTDPLNPQVQDEEVAFALAQSKDNIFYAAAFCAKTLASKYANRVDVELDGILLARYSKLSDNFTQLAERLERDAKAKSASLSVGAGGLPTTSTINRLFYVGQFDNPPNQFD